jgi:DNA modification methylase
MHRQLKPLPDIIPLRLDLHSNTKGKVPKGKDAVLFEKYADILSINSSLTRGLVSFQGNKNEPFYRWLKFKEAFSKSMVKYFLDQYKPKGVKLPHVLDPFAGIGTTLTSASEAGWKATGIEIMPVGIAALKARIKANQINVELFESHLNNLRIMQWNYHSTQVSIFNVIRITKGAFSEKTENEISIFLDFIKGINDTEISYLFWFACLSILEDISFTRKDGQYLRWDSRASKVLKSKFNKGQILDFKHAILRKLEVILQDIKYHKLSINPRRIKIIEGSCLEELPNFPDDTFNLIITSPPYCNRYDYTRTYALELAFMGNNGDKIRNIRQCLLSCTVENRSKRAILESNYMAINREDFYRNVIYGFESQFALTGIINNLLEAKAKGKLNNNNIPNLVYNYFFEMNFVIYELYRVLVPGGRIVMVNDNVQYNGEAIPVDLILSDFAANAGFSIEHIWVLPNGKGNSSQQMGVHGRNELRKCVYVWKKND